MRNRSSLNWSAALVVAGMLAGGAVVRGAAEAPLDPNGFTSLGPLSGATTYVFNTGNGTSTPTLTENGSTIINGVISNGMAVFDFSSITINTGSSVTASGALPLAILSRSGATLNGGVNVGAVGASAGPGGFAGLAILGGNGPGAIGGISGGDSGAGFGGAGGNGGEGQGGPTYSDPDHAFLGGSGAGGDPATDSPGGGGGGGLEISALGDITIGGNGIRDNGGNGGTTAGPFGGGGGSGGGIFIATPGQISVSNVITANGGNGGAGSTFGGGGGGGGRILIESAKFVDTVGGPTESGGTPGASEPGIIALGGSNGSLEFNPYVNPVPEPGLIVLGMGAAIAMLRRRR